MLSADTDAFHSFDHHCEPRTKSNVSNILAHKQITSALIKVAEILKIFLFQGFYLYLNLFMMI